MNELVPYNRYYYFRGKPYATVKDIAETFCYTQVEVREAMSSLIDGDSFILRSTLLKEFKRQNPSLKATGQLRLITPSGVTRIHKRLTYLNPNSVDEKTYNAYQNLLSKTYEIGKQLEMKFIERGQEVIL